MIRRHAAWAILASVLGVSACDDTQIVTPTSLPPGVEISVVTYNLYLGADLQVLFGATLEPSAVGPLVAGTLNAVRDSHPEDRMDAIAQQIATAQPDVIALQEVSLWRTQAPADGLATHATTVAYDFLALVVDGLARRGLSYTVEVEATHTDIEVTGDFSGSPVDVRFTDRDVLLVRAGLPVGVTRREQGQFTATLVVPTLAFDTVTVQRGWALVDTVVAGRPVRFVDTHLEAAADQIRDLQAAELLAGPAVAEQEVLLGDFNFAPGALPYRGFEAVGLIDGWTEVAPADPAPTCCQAADLRNPDPAFVDRIDSVFLRGPFSATAAERLGETQADRIAAGLWPSDHAGVHMRILVQ